MKRTAFFDTKPYDRKWFDILDKNFEITYFREKLSADTAVMCKGFDAVIVFVNDSLDADTVEKLIEYGVKIIALRCSGYNNVDFRVVADRIPVVRVPVYSPYSVAEHAMALLLCLNRKINRAYNRTREFNFSIDGLQGSDLNGKTAGIIGTGQIGRIFIKICKGFGMNVIAYDPYPIKNPDFEYTDLETLYRKSDVISLHCPLTENSKHILNSDSFSKMKNSAYIINTSRGGLIESESLLDALKNGKIAGAGLDVYEEESHLFFEDYSTRIVNDDILSLLVSLPNVIITSHQGFLTDEALKNIAEITVENLNDFFAGRPLKNQINIHT
ncbi:MAG TPA: hydroxyacid dehydrogenase [Ruminococcus sp.]|nr:hydroxyacid dehydrogenase [Ruminococcus sp.]